MELSNSLLNAMLVACDQLYNPDPDSNLQPYDDSAQGKGANDAQRMA